MSDSDSNTPGRRRSQRERKTFKPFTSIDSNLNKRKRVESDADDLDSGLEDNQSDQDQDQEEDDEEDFKAPKAKLKTTLKAKAKSGAAPAGKKLRTSKTVVPKPPKINTRKPRKGKDAGGFFDANKIQKDTKITADNPLFNATMNPSAALQSTAEDFLESLSQTPAPAQAELINYILRACGCNDSVDADEVMDYDGVVDTLDNFTESLKQENSPVYPLTSKLPVFKKFRKSLSEFLERLIASSAELGSLYTSDLMATLQTWVIAMSSSQIRSFRHTATVVALEVETALCDVAAAVEKEAEIVGRQREGERKRKGANKGGGREKEFEGKAAEVRERRTKLAEFLKEFVDGVFVHRYRDLDSNIRAECVRAMGFWFKKYPGHFLEGAYLRYVGWVLSDSSTQVRLEAVKSLSGVYQQNEYIGSLNHFTERFKPRLIEMATGDTELSVRVAVIQVLGAINEQSLLDDDERESLCLLVFDEEPKVRKAVSQFVKGVWEESVKERLVGRKASEKDEERAGVKMLGSLLVKWGKALDRTAADVQGDVDGADKESLSSGEGSSRISKNAQVVSLMGSTKKGRIALAVEALWTEVDPVSDWESLLDHLLLDHSATEEEGAENSSGRKGRPKKAVNESLVDEIWRLEEVEETVLLECLLATLTKARAEAGSSKKGEEEVVASDITRALIKGLPRLFIKYQTDENRIANVLLIPLLMNLDMYLEMRMITAYASLWDDVTKQFTSHSSLTVLKHAVVTICHFLSATSLSNTNSTKILELDDELASSLRDAVAGRDEIEVASFTEDEVLSLSAISARLASLAGTRDMTSWMEEDEGGKQSNAWDITMALAERGRLGYKEEEQMIEQALNVLNLHIIWKARGLTSAEDPSADEAKHRESLKEQRDTLLEKLVEYAVGTQSNTGESVKRVAFQILMNLHVLFCPTETVGPDGSAFPTAPLALSLDDEVQYRCAGFIQAEIERYAEELGETVPTLDKGSDEGDSSESEDGLLAKAGKGNLRRGKKAKDLRKYSRSQLEREYIFMGVMSTFLRAIRAGAVNIRHGAVLLAHYGRFGTTFDECSKIMVEVLREEGMYNGNPDIVVSVVTQAIRESFTLVLDGVVDNETNTFALSKQLASAFLIRGAQLSVVRRIDNQFVVQVHTTLLTWIGKRLAIYESNNNKKARKTAIVFFRILIPMLSTLDSRDALKIKAHMDQVLAQAKIEVLASKHWEPQRAYEKRLGIAMSKDKASGAKSRKSKATKNSSIATSDEDEESEVEDIIDETQTTAPVARPRPRPTYRSPAVQEQDPITETDDEVVEEAPQSPLTVSPKSRPRPKATYKSPTKSPIGQSHLVADEGATAQTPRKREREDVEDEQSLTEEEGGSPARQGTPSSEIQIRRKRIRH